MGRNGQKELVLNGLMGVVCAFSVHATPVDLSVHGTVYQSSDFSASYPASKAIDGDPTTFTHTANLSNSYWQVTLDAPMVLYKIELVNRHNVGDARMGGLTLRIMDINSNTVDTAAITNPGLGGSWTYYPSANTTGQIVRVGLENGNQNDLPDYFVSLAIVNLFAGTNLAIDADAYAVRLTDALAPASNGNDDDYATEFVTTDKTVDGYWETDLGGMYALSFIRTVAATGLADKLTNTILRLYDDQHQSVYSHSLKDADRTSATFDIALDDPVCAQYVRVGLENKQRTHPTGGIQWHIGVKEVQAFGRPADEVGILSFETTTNKINSGGSVTLSWEVEKVHDVQLYPNVGSVDAQTDTNGIGSIILSPTNSVEYILTATNRNITYRKYVSIIVDDVNLPVRISEFVADNSISARDGFNNSPDWIELHNPSETNAILTGCGLSDNPAQPMKWVFPATNIPPHGYLTVYASGHADPYDPVSGIHADFQLNKSTGSVLLTTADGLTTIDSFLLYPEQDEDLAYGRDMDGNVTFIDPTPGEANIADTYTGWLQKPLFSHTRGFYDIAFDLSLTNNNAGATLLYSLDGSEPGLAYTGAMNIAETKCVRARITKAGYRSTDIRTRSFIFLDEVITSGVMDPGITQDPQYSPRIRQGLLDLPTISIATGGEPDYPEQPCSVEFMWPDSGKDKQADCGIFRFGNAWTKFAKRSFRLKFREEYGTRKLNIKLFEGHERGLPVANSFDSLELRSGSQDMVQRGFYMASRFVCDTVLDMDSVNPHGQFVHLYLNGTYWGQYHLRERLADHFLADTLGGSAEDYVNVRGNDNVGSSFVIGTPEPPNRYSWEQTRALSGNYSAVKSYLDVQHLVDFMLLFLYGNCETEYRAAGPITTGSGFKFWLADSDGFLRTSAMGLDRTGNSGPAGIWGNLVAEGDSDFETLLADRIYKHFFNDGALTPDKNTARLAERMTEIEDSMIAECARWGYRTPANWISAADNIYNNLFPGRTTQLFGYLESQGLYPSVDPPQCNQHGGNVTNGFEVELTADTGTIYFTIDGSDPRDPGGGISSNAVLYQAGPTNDILITSGSIWRYWDLGGIPASNWHDAAYSDAAWSNGPAQLGYGDGDEATVISYGTNANDKFITSYFRTTFVVTNEPDVEGLVVKLLRDDGAVIYLNGTELMRDNMPPGPIDTNTVSSTTVGGAGESTFYSSSEASDLIVAGTNLLAVEVHQANGTSTDTSFDLVLEAQLTRPPALNSIIVSNNMVLKSRVWTGSEWSALSEALFLMAERKPAESGNVLITEINYNPPGALDELEFIEIMNTSTSLVDLTGASLSNGVSFNFPDNLCLEPGDFVLVVEDEVAFSNCYQTIGSTWYYSGLTVAGKWSGALNNGGETIALVASNGTTILSVPYSDGGDWPERCDGNGSSLELTDPDSAPTNQAALISFLENGLNWQSSPLYYGSPGRLDSYVNPVVINEVLSHTDATNDWIELYNRTDQPVDLTGRYLSDKFDSPFRYQFPANSILPAGAFTNINSITLGFGFSELGSDAILTEANGTNIIRYIDTVDFPAAEREEPFGRFMKSDGETDFTELRATTQDSTNALPRIGPVVISEIMYRPASNMAEYIEIINITNTTVKLYDPAYPTNTWVLSGAIDYTFPTNEQISSCVPTIVCATNPAAFRAQYGLDPSVPVYGPWTGKLNNAGESIKLRRPGDPEPDGFVPYYRVDRTAYRPTAPWPTNANTGNISLERIPLEGYGNDPAYWTASEPGGSPGTVVGNRLPVIYVSGTNAVDEGSLLSITLSGVDLDVPWQSVLSINTSSIPVGSTFNTNNGLFQWTPGEADGPAVHDLRFIVTDSCCIPGIATQTVSITVREVNQPPILDPITDIVFPSMAFLDRLLTASDPDLPTQTLTFAESGLPADISLDPGTGLLSGGGTATGIYAVVVTVSDNQAPPLYATNNFTLTLTAPFLMEAVFNATSSASFSFPTYTGETYEAEYRDNLVTGDWQLLQRIENCTTNLLEIIDTDSTNTDHRYYRVRWLP